MSILLKSKQDKKNVMFIKGAPDYLLQKSTKILNKNGDIVNLTNQAKDKFMDQIKVCARKGLRTLAICYKEDCGVLNDYDGPKHKAHSQLKETENYAKLESDPVMIGVVAVRDPPRPEVAESIRKCRDAGISVIMITGDIKETAESIAKDIAIIEDGQEKGRSLTGHEFEALSEEAKVSSLRKVIDHPSGFVFSRTDPRHKR